MSGSTNVTLSRQKAPQEADRKGGRIRFLAELLVIPEKYGVKTAPRSYWEYNENVP